MMIQNPATLGATPQITFDGSVWRVLIYDTHSVLSYNSETNTIETSPSLNRPAPAFTPGPAAARRFHQHLEEVSSRIQTGQYDMRQIMSYWYVFYKKADGQVVWKHVG